MFELLNTNVKAPLVVKVSYEGLHIEFTIGSIINKKQKDDINPNTQFKLLNAYVDYKGEDFKKKLFKAYQEAEKEIMNSIMTTTLEPLPYSSIHSIIDMFDATDIMLYLKTVYGLQAPAILNDVYDEQAEKDGRITRVQTYIKDDYYNLAVVSVILKSVLAPIAYFGFVKNSEINSLHKEYTLYELVRTHKVHELPGLEKARGLVGKLIEINTRDEAVAAITVIEKQISRSELPDHIYSKIALQKIAMGDLINDNRNGGNDNLVTKMYNHIINNLAVKGDSKNKISDKKPMLDKDSGDKESIVEAYRMTTELTRGTEEELDWSVSDPYVVCKQLSVEIDMEIVNKARMFTSTILDHDFIKEQENILACIFKNIIDPRGIPYLTETSMLNLITIGFAYLWQTGHKELALIVCSITVPNDSNLLYMGTSMNKNRIPPALKEELNVYFPYQRRINAEKTINSSEEWINNLANNLLDKRWSTLVTKEFTEQVFGKDGFEIILPSNIKILLAEFLIDNEKRINENVEHR